MRKVTIILSLVLSHLGFSQISHPGVTSTASAAGDHAFVGTKSDGVFSNWLDTGYSATAYNLLGFTNQHAGFGIADGNNIVSPMIWMYANERNAFRVRTINFNTNITSGTDLFTVRANGNVGVGTAKPTSVLDVHTTDDNTPTGIVISQGTTSNNRNSGRLFFENLGELNNSFAIVKIDDRLSFRSNSQAGISSGTEHFNIKNNGVVGIGISNPEHGKLHINGNGAGQGINLWTHSGETTSRIWIDNQKKTFHLSKGDNPINGITISNNGLVGIGEVDPDSKLSVNGNIHTKEVKVDLIGWSDFVFENNYNLPTLKEVEQHIKEKGHLKDIPSAKEVAKNGILLGEMDAKLLQKIEELTLYTINQEKRIKSLESKNEKLILLVEKLLGKTSEE